MSVRDRNNKYIKYITISHWSLYLYHSLEKYIYIFRYFLLHLFVIAHDSLIGNCVITISCFTLFTYHLSISIKFMIRIHTALFPLVHSSSNNWSTISRFAIFSMFFLLSSEKISNYSNNRTTLIKEEKEREKKIFLKTSLIYETCYVMMGGIEHENLDYRSGRG